MNCVNTTKSKIITVCIRLLYSSVIPISLFFLDASYTYEHIVTTSSILVTLCSTLLGFFIASVAILASLLDKTLLQNMIKTEQLNYMFKEIFHTCISLVVVIILAVSILFTTSPIANCIFYLVILSIGYSFVMLFTSGYKFYMVMNTLSTSKK